MGQLLHGSARTTAAVRRAIQPRQESLAKLAARYDLNPKTIAKGKTRPSVHDAPMGPKQPHSTVLTKEEEALIVTFRWHTLLPLDDCLDAVQATLPHLTRSARHRCVPRHAISRLPAVEGDQPQKKPFKSSPIGSFHLDSAEVRTEEGKLSLFVAIDRTSKFASAERHTEAVKTVAAQCLRTLMARVPYTLHTVLTDHGLQLTTRKQDQYAFTHIFARVCEEHALAHRLTKPTHPWTHGQVERMNRTLKEATVKTDYDQPHQPLTEHLHAFLMASNVAKRLTTLRGLTPDEYICQRWQKEPERLTMNPYHHTLGPNI